MPTDYQWPSLDTTTDPYIPDEEPAKRRSLVRDIESFFESRLDGSAVLVPSGRAAIAMILERHDVVRGQTVFAPAWSSHCVWDAITSTATPRSTYHEDTDVVLAVHRWGRPHTLTTETDALVIEDSVDSVFTSGETLLPNDGRYEVLSLPKTFGSFTGGIVLTREENDADRLREMREDAVELGRHQSKLRYQQTRGDGPEFQHWEYLERRNRYLDLNAVTNIQSCLENYDRNLETIRRRLSLVSKRLGDTPDVPTRLPPVLTFPMADGDEYDDAVMIRHVNESRLVDEPAFEPAALLPIHFGVDEDTFRYLLDQIVGD